MAWDESAPFDPNDPQTVAAMQAADASRAQRAAQEEAARVEAAKTLAQRASERNAANEVRANPSNYVLKDEAGNVVASQGPAAPALAAPVTPGNRYASASAPEGAGGASPAFTMPAMGGGGAVTVPAHEVKAVSDARQAKLGEALDAEGRALEGQQEATRQSANAAGDVEEAKAVGSRYVAKTSEVAGAETQRRAKAAADESKAFRQHIDDFAAKLAQDKIDPNRMYASASTARNITWAVAEGFGAVAQGFLRLPTNQIADRIAAMAAQDVAVQRENHQIGREHLADMNTAYAQALKATGDREEAERVATGYALESAKQEAQALAQSATGAAQKAKGEELVEALKEKQAQLGQKKVEREIAMNPMVQAKQVATGPDLKKIGADAQKYIEEQAKLGTRVSPDEAFRWSIKMNTGRDPLGAAGRNVPYAGGAKAEPGGKQEEMEKARTEVNGVVRMVDNALESGKAFKQGVAGNLWSHVPGATQSKIDRMEREKYNAQVKAGVGAGWKLVTSGMEPKNPGIIEELSAHYMIDPSDSEEFARAKMGAFQDMLRDAGASKGVIYDNVQRDAKGLPSSFAKPGG